MEYRLLGNSGLRVSTLCLGSMTFGEADENSFMHNVGSDEKTAFSIMDRALDAGVNFFDTADVYGQDGLSERVMGRWFKYSATRDNVVLATKFRFRMTTGPNGTGASRYHLVRACEDSLRRLQTDHIDLYQVHMQDLDTPEEETLRALDDLVHQGKVLYIGASNYAAYRLCNSLWLSKSHNLSRFISLQAKYNLLERAVEREHVPLCQEHGLGLLPWSPLAGGLLSGKYHAEQQPPAGTRFEQWKDQWRQVDTEPHWKIVSALNAFASELGHTPAQIALAWLLRKPGVASVIFGARTLAQLEDNLETAQLTLPDAFVTKLDEASGFAPGYPYDFMAKIQGRW